LAGEIGRVEKASTGAGWATVPGADQDTVICVAGSAPQVSSNCSGAVVVGSGSVVVGGPLGGFAAKARGARTVVPPSAAMALTPALPMMNLRRVNPGLPAVSAAMYSLMAVTLGNTSEHRVAAVQPWISR
jgi:hypothetical protein